MSEERNYIFKGYDEKGSVKYENETLFVTDPCYIIPDSVWDKFVHYSSDEIIEALRKMGYEKPILVDNTGYGDWNNRLTDPETGKILGHFGADAGMFIVCALSDVKKNNKCGLKTIEDFEGYGAVIKDFTGTVKYGYETYSSYGYESILAVIEGEGTTNFKSLSSKDE